MKTVKMLYTLFLMTFVSILLVIARRYDWDSALFPTLVGFATLALGIIALTAEIMPGLSRFFESDLFQIGPEKSKGPQAGGEINFRNFIITSFWIFLMLALVLFLGFLISIPLWVLCYVGFQGKRPWGYAFLTAFVLWLFIYGFFVKTMGVTLFQGILFGDRI